MKSILPLLIAVLLLPAIGCANRAMQPANTISPGGIPGLALPDITCFATDQDQYVWHPTRLQVLWPCVRAVGTVMEMSSGEADGDSHIHLKLDAAYEPLLKEGNQSLKGYLVVEAVCIIIPPHPEALQLCASDPDPFPGPYPSIGDHIWVEGRYVQDSWHHSWAELHPLYRWGMAKP